MLVMSTFQGQRSREPISVIPQMKEEDISYNPVKRFFKNVNPLILYDFSNFAYTMALELDTQGSKIFFTIFPVIYDSN